MQYVTASAHITASAAGNGILVLIACILFFAGAGAAWLVSPRAVWAMLTSGGLAVYMLSLLIGG